LFRHPEGDPSTILAAAKHADDTVLAVLGVVLPLEEEAEIPRFSLLRRIALVNGIGLAASAIC
jgi:hypothetical protein